MSAPHRSAVLHVTAARGGGVDRHIRDLAAATRRRNLILHVGTGIDVLEDVGARRFAPLRDVAGSTASAAQFAGWLRNAGVGIFDLHSVDKDCRGRAAALGAGTGFPYVVTLHDLTFVNPRAFDATGAPAPDPRWIAELEDSIGGAAAIVAPSAFIRDAAAHAFPGLPITTIAEGIRVPPARTAPAAPADFAVRAPAHVVAVVGAIGPHKGSDLLEQLALALDGTDIGIAVIGYTDRRLLRGWHLPDRCYVHGPYIDDELPGWLAAYRAEVVLFPNRMPESFSLTLSEVWAAGVPVIVPDCGALGERVARYGGGWRLPAEFTAAAAKSALVHLFSAEGAAERMAVRLKLASPDHGRVPNVETMARDTDALYDHFALAPSRPVEAVDLATLTPLLAANLDGFEFRKELVLLTAEIAELKSVSARECRIDELAREADAARVFAASLEKGVAEAQAWARKLEADVETLNAELARMIDQKTAFDSLPAFVRRLLLRTVRHARR